MIAYLVVRLILAFPSLAPLAVRLLDRAVPRFRRIARDNLLKAGYANPDPIIDGVFRSITRIIQTFADFQLVYVLTGGGPANATHLFATYAYQIGIVSGILSEGAAVSLAMFPFLFLIVVVQLLYIRRVETR